MPGYNTYNVPIPRVRANPDGTFTQIDSVSPLVNQMNTHRYPVIGHLTENGMTFSYHAPPRYNIPELRHMPPSLSNNMMHIGNGFFFPLDKQ